MFRKHWKFPFHLPRSPHCHQKLWCLWTCLQCPSLWLSISKSWTQRPQRIQGKNCYFIAFKQKSQSLALLCRCFSLALEVVGFSLFLGPRSLYCCSPAKHSRSPVILTLWLSISTHPTRSSAPDAPFSRGLLGKACWLASSSPAVDNTHPPAGDEHTVNGRAVTSSPRRRMWWELSVTVRTKNTSVFELHLINNAK